MGKSEIKAKQDCHQLCRRCKRDCKQKADTVLLDCRRFDKKTEYKQMVLFKK